MTRVLVKSPKNSQQSKRKLTTNEKITLRMIERLKAGVAPWKAPFASGGLRPNNPKTGTVYSGYNYLALLMHCSEHHPGKAPMYITYNQAREWGGHVRKGATGEMVIYAKKFMPKSERSKPKDQQEEAFMLKTYHVFHVADCDGLNVQFDLKATARPFSPIEACHRLLEGSPATPAIIINPLKGPYYSPQKDYISLPQAETAISAEEYYNTLFHELAHATGHPKRLNRFAVSEKPAPRKYAAEELIAELTAAFLADFCGILPQTEANTASYLAHWVQQLDEYPEILIPAAAQADKAAQYIINHAPGLPQGSQHQD